MINNSILDEIFDIKLKNKGFELEAIIIKEITSEQFKNLANFLTVTGYLRKDEPEILDINFYTNNKKDNVSIRYTITGLDDIRNYCRTEKPLNFTKLFKSTLVWSEQSRSKLEKQNIKLNWNTISVIDYDYNIKINLKNEIMPNENGMFIDKIAQDEDNNLKAIIDRQGYENILKTFRFKKRTSFYTSDNNFRIDMSIIKTSKKTNSSHGRLELLKTKTFKESNCLNEKEYFEVEIEYIGNSQTDKPILKSQFDKNIKLVLTKLFSKTDIVISNSLISKVIDEYTETVRDMLVKSIKLQLDEIKQNKETPYNLLTTVKVKTKDEMIIYLETNLDKITKGRGYYKLDKSKPGKYFYGPKPVSMNIENIQENYPINILNGFTVTDKADGETCILFVNQSGEIYMIDSNMNIYGVSLENNKSITNIYSTILIGEYISGDIPAFYCFDCYVHNGNDARILPLVASDGHKSRIQTAKDITKNLNKISNLSLKLNVKKFLWDKNQSIFSLTKAVWDNRDNYPYRLDGVIYTPIDYPVGFEPNKMDWISRLSSTWNYNMKWKPPQENTIDFLIKIDKEHVEIDKEKGIYIEKDKIRYKTIINGEKIEFQPYKTIHLYCGFTVNITGKACQGVSSLIPINPNLPQLGEEANKYKATLFTPTNPYNELAYIAHIPCNEEKNNSIFGIHDNQKIVDNTIVEFAYDLNTEADTDDDKAFRWKPLRTRVEKTDAYLKAIREKVRIYNIYLKYRDLDIQRGYQWSKYEKDEIDELHLLIRTYNLKELGNKKDWHNYIYATITSKDNRRRLDNIIESALDIPVEINYGNNFKTANAIWRSIYYPITEQMITTGEKIPNELDAEVLYYNRTDNLIGRDKSLTYPLQDFHNRYIKNYSLYEVVTQALRQIEPDINIHLLDLACGKAGDLYKWNEKKISNVVGIDLNQNNIDDINDGACVRYVEFKKRMEAFGQTKIPLADFLVGDISQNIKDGSAMKTEDTIVLQNRLWENIYKERGFDMISVQFAIHYMFENEGKLDGFIKNISQNLRTGGYFMGTCFDGSTIFRTLKSKKKGQSISGSKDDNIIWKIKKMYDLDADDIPKDSTSLGLPIDVYIQSINQSITEYLVSFDYLVKKLEEVHLELISTSTFDKIYDKFKAEIRHPLSPDEQSLSFMNRLFIFKKKSSMGIGVDEAYSEILKNKSTEKFNQILSRAIKSSKWSDLEKLLEVSKIKVENFDQLKKKLAKEYKVGRLVLEPLRKKTVQQLVETPKLLKKIAIEKDIELEKKELPITSNGKICGVVTNPPGNQCVPLESEENSQYCTYNTVSGICNKKKGAPKWSDIQEILSKKKLVESAPEPKQSKELLTEVEPQVLKKIVETSKKELGIKVHKESLPKSPSGKICGVKTNPPGSSCILLDNEENSEYCTFNEVSGNCNKKKGAPTWDKIQAEISKKIKK